MGKTTEKDPRITKRRVTMKSVFLGADGKVYEHEAIDYVPDDDRDVLAAYVADARARGWQHVEVSEEPDAGPGGYDGATAIPRGTNRVGANGAEEFVPFPHPRAGTYFPASDCKNCTHAPEGFATVRAED